MKYDPKTKKGREAIAKAIERLRPELEALREESETGIDREPGGNLTNPSEIQVKRMLKHHEDK